MGIECPIETEITDTGIILKKCRVKGEFIVPEFISIIGTNLFLKIYSMKFELSECSTDITKLIMHDSIKEIQDYSFSDCVNMVEVVIPKSVTKIGRLAFYSCKSIEEINIPNSVMELGYCVFNCCTSLKTLTLPLILKSSTQYLSLPKECKKIYT